MSDHSVGLDMLDELEEFLNSLFSSEILESQSSVAARCICYGSWECLQVPLFSKEQCSGGGLYFVQFLCWHSGHWKRI